MKRFFTGIIASIVVAAAFTGCNEVKKENYVTYSTSDSSSVQQNSMIIQILIILKPPIGQRLHLV